GESYDGKIQSTPEGRICQRWVSQHPHTHGFVTWTSHGGITHNENFCRNPGKGGSVNSNGPWCFTMDPNKTFEFCTNVPYCPEGTFDCLCFRYSIQA
ncbi:hypothetical protein CAPTEDRAFT_119907, partial [Capitella teleta]